MYSEMIDIRTDSDTHSTLGIIALESCLELGDKIDKRIIEKRSAEVQKNIPDTYRVPTREVRFSNGEGKVKIIETVRGKDIYILCDIGNYSCTYNMYGFKNHKGPDEHFQDIKRALSAVGGKAHRTTVIMPLMYSSRQHRRKGRESLDCAMALQELEKLGVNDVLTFDVHDPNIQNAAHLVSFENLYPTYDIVKKLIENEKDIFLNKSETLIISPDTGAMDRAIYYSEVLGLDIGLFYKRRDHSVIVKGKNPIVQHEYMGRPIEGQNILIVDDMISSGESMVDVVKFLKEKKAKKIFMAVTFSLFTEGTKKFDKMYAEGLFDKLYSTNLTYAPKEVLNAPWYEQVDLSNFLADIIDNLNNNKSIEPLIQSTYDLRRFINEKRNALQD